MIVGVVLTVMLIALATLDQYSAAIWVIVILAVVGGAVYFYFISKDADKEMEKLE